MDIAVELSRVVISETGDQQLIFLREKDGRQRTFPIVIGINEALAIDRRVKGIETPRPMTHDLIDNLLEAFDATLERIVVDDLRQDALGGGTFIATIYLRQGDRILPVDSRPSDAIAVSCKHDVPLFVTDTVMDQVTASPQTAEQRVELLRRRRDALAKQIRQFSEHLNDPDFLDSLPEEVAEKHRQQLADMSREYEAIDRILKKLNQ